MILINLLPQEYRILEKPKSKITYQHIFVAAFALFLLFSVYHLFLYLQIHQENRSLNAQWESLKVSNAQADQLITELGSSILAEVDFYDAFVDPSLQAARILNLVSDLIPKNLFLTEVKFLRKGHEFQVFLLGVSETPRAGTTLVEIQNYANGIKKQLEEVINRDRMGIRVQKRSLRTEVTTANRQQVEGENPSTQFKITLKSEGFKEE